MKIWLPWIGDLSLIKKFRDTSVVGFFGSCPDISSSAREKSVLATQDRQKFYEAIHEIHRAKMKFAYVFNSIVDLDDLELIEVINDIDALKVDRLVVASPRTMKLAVEMGSQPEIEVSTVAEITNPSQCADWAELGATKFTLSTKLSRFPRVIVEEFGGFDVKVLVNEICNLNCIFRKTHYINQSRGVNFKNYPYRYCQAIMRKNWPEQMLKNSWVLPSQLKEYPDNVEFKIVGRTQPSWRIKQWAALYLSEIDPLDIMDILPYGKAAGDETEHAGIKPVEGEHLHLFKKGIDPEFFEFFKDTRTPCYARNCKECGLCRRVASNY